jgi:tripartite-type tricarboxylate transporter receptor subunit TctC
MNKKLIVGVGTLFFSAGFLLLLNNYCYSTHECCLPHGSVDNCCPSRMVVGVAPGGPTDRLARIFTDELRSIVGGPVIVENRPGAGGALATELVKTAPPNGKTILVGGLGNVLGSALNAKVVDLTSDLVPIAPLGAVEQVLATHSSFPAKNMNEFIALAKNRPDVISIGSAGVGTVSHLTIEAIKLAAGIKLTHIPYKGTGEVLQDIMSGTLVAAVIPLPTLLPHIKTGKVRALATLGARRSSLLPDTPTAKEVGLNTVDWSVWYGLFAPAGTSSLVSQSINNRARAILEKPEIKQKLSQEGIEVSSGSVSAFTVFVRAERMRLGQVVRDAGIRRE